MQCARAARRCKVRHASITGGCSVHMHTKGCRQRSVVVAWIARVEGCRASRSAAMCRMGLARLCTMQHAVDGEARRKQSCACMCVASAEKDGSVDCSHHTHTPHRKHQHEALRCSEQEAIGPECGPPMSRTMLPPLDCTTPQGGAACVNKLISVNKLIPCRRTGASRGRGPSSRRTRTPGRPCSRTPGR